MPEAPHSGQAIAAHTVPPDRKDALALLLIAVAAVLLRLSSFVPAVVDTDEGLYMVQAREWLHGGWPLVAAWDMHPIGAPAMFALAFLALGPSVEAARALGLVCVIATGCALYAAARGVGAPRAVGVAAGVLYAAQSVLLSGLSTNTELLMAPFVAGSMAIAMRGAARSLGPAATAPGFGAVTAMGLLIGCALLIKQVSAPAGCFAFALLTAPALFRRLLPWRRLIGMAALYALLCATPFVLAGLAYWSRGWLDQYLDGSLLAPFRYSMERIEAVEAWRRVTAAMLQLGFGLAGATAALAFWRPRAALQPLSLLTAFAAAWFVVATVAISGPGFYFAHYFLLWLPPVSLLAAIGTWRLAGAMARTQHARAAFLLLAGVVAFDAWLCEVQYRVERGYGLFSRDPVREVAAQVRAAAGPGGSALIANYHPSVYVMAGVRPATRFPFPAHLTGVFEDLSDTSTEAELERVLASRPKVIVVDRGWMQTMRPAAAAQVMEAVRRGYDLAGSVLEIRGPVEIYRAR